MDIVRTKAQRLKADGRQDRATDRADERRGDVWHQIRHDLAEQDAQLALAVGACDPYVRPLANGEHLRADGASGMHPGQRGDRQAHQFDRHVADAGGDDDHDGQAGHGHQRVGQDPDDRVHGTSEKAGQQAQGQTNGQTDDARNQTDAHGLRRAKHHNGQHVAALGVGAEQVLNRWRLRRFDRPNGGELRVDEVRAEQREEHDQAQHEQADEQASAHARAAQDAP